MSAHRFCRFGCVHAVSFIFAFALCVTIPLRADVSPDGTEMGDGGSGSDGKDAKSTATTTEQETEYKNWIEVGVGGTWTSGDRAQFEQQHWIPGDQPFGGITDMHLEHGVGEKATLSIDGHALWDINDYDIKVDLSQPNVGYLRGGYTAFRTWYDGNGGFFPPGRTWFPPPFPEMHIDRDEVWLELGVRLPDWPEMTIHWSHQIRDGQKDSTIWGDTTLTGLPLPPPGTNNPTRKLAPAYRDIDEVRDFLTFDATKTFGNTDIGVGMRWEHNENNDKLQMERGAGQVPPLPPKVTLAQRFFTQHEDDTIDDFNGHVLSETRFTDNFWFTAAYSYSALSADLTGSRIEGTHYNSMFGEIPAPPFQTFDEQFLNLAGVSEVKEHVFNSNLFWVPFKDLSVIVGFRYTREDKDSDATWIGLTFGNPVPRVQNIRQEAASTSEGLDNLAERFEARYTHIKDWLFYAEGEWQEEWGDVHEQVEGGGQMNKDTNLFGQKYTVGATWYPLTYLNMAAQYYYKAADYDNDFHSDVTDENNERLIGQDWTTNDANVRITARPKLPESIGTLSLVTRYDFMQTDISGKWGISPAKPMPTGLAGTVLNEEWTGLITNHVVSESATWNPCPRFYLQAIGSYVFNQTETPASDIILFKATTGTARYNSPTVVDFRNDFWTVTGATGYVLDEYTDLRADYTFYCANDHFKNSRVAMPYGLGSTEHTVSAMASRQFTKQIRLTLQYRFFDYRDQLFGGHNNYTAHSIFSGLQYRF